MLYRKVTETKHIWEFSSITDFVSYLDTNDTGYSSTAKDMSYSYNSFCGTKSYEDAKNMLVKGWTGVAVDLTNKLKTIEAQPDIKRQIQSFISQAGFHPIVPLYLAGAPCNMVNQRFTTPKQKIVTVTKSVGFRGMESVSKIKNESVKTLMVVKTLEAQGYRVNLNCINTWTTGNNTCCVKIKLKSAGERLNISKLAFPLVNPSMLRRMLFRFRELTAEAHYTANGCSQYDRENNAFALADNEVFIPSFMKLDMTQIKNLKDMQLGDSFEVLSQSAPESSY